MRWRPATTILNAAWPDLYLLDTDICSYLMNGGYPALDRHTRSIPPQDIAVSSITHAEIWYGLSKVNAGLRRRIAAELFLEAFANLDWPVETAYIYGRLRARLERSGNRLDDHDLMIASHAIVTDATLVTNNTRHFSRIGTPLKLENWLEP